MPSSTTHRGKSHAAQGTTGRSQQSGCWRCFRLAAWPRPPCHRHSRHLAALILDFTNHSPRSQESPPPKPGTPSADETACFTTSCLPSCLPSTASRPADGSPGIALPARRLPMAAGFAGRWRRSSSVSIPSSWHIGSCFVRAASSHPPSRPKSSSPIVSRGGTVGIRPAGTMKLVAEMIGSPL